jgi:hypothetical protein
MTRTVLPAGLNLNVLVTESMYDAIDDEVSAHLRDEPFERYSRSHVVRAALAVYLPLQRRKRAMRDARRTVERPRAAA